MEILKIFISLWLIYALIVFQFHEFKNDYTINSYEDKVIQHEHGEHDHQHTDESHSQSTNHNDLANCHHDHFHSHSDDPSPHKHSHDHNSILFSGFDDHFIPYCIDFNLFDTHTKYRNIYVLQKDLECISSIFRPPILSFI